MAIPTILTILAIVVAPFLAVWAQSQLDAKRTDRAKRHRIFKVLMATRGEELARDRVQALNMINLEFCQKGDTEVRAAWKAYLDTLNNAPTPTDDPGWIALHTTWVDDCINKSTELLEAMANRLGYSFDKVDILRGCYAPQGHFNERINNADMRTLMLQLLRGESALRVSPTEPS